MTTRAEATERVTCQATAWLWHSRGCRAIAREAGLSLAGGITTPWSGRWRIDLAAASVRSRSVRTYIVEVKGTAQDLTRERIAGIESRAGRYHSKWHHEHFARDHELWVACGDLKTGWLAHGDVPEHWGVAVFDEQGKMTVLRKAPRSIEHDIGDACVRDAFIALAEVQTSEQMPRAFNVRNVRKHGMPWERLLNEGWAEERFWTRDNKDTQMEMFHAEKSEDRPQQVDPRRRRRSSSLTGR